MCGAKHTHVGGQTQCVYVSDPPNNAHRLSNVAMQCASASGGHIAFISHRLFFPNIFFGHTCSKICARSNAHNSLQFRPFSTKKILSKKAFRDATRGDAPEAVAPQIRLISVFFHETHSVTTFFDETWCVKKSSPRRICMQSLGWIRAKSRIFVPKTPICVKKIGFFA